MCTCDWCKQVQGTGTICSEVLLLLPYCLIAILQRPPPCCSGQQEMCALESLTVFVARWHGRGRSLQSVRSRASCE